MVAGWASISQIYWIARDYVGSADMEVMLKRMEAVAGNASLRETMVRLGAYHQDHRDEGLEPESHFSSISAVKAAERNK